MLHDIQDEDLLQEAADEAEEHLQAQLQSRCNRQGKRCYKCYVLMPLVLFPDCQLITILLSRFIVCPIPNSEALRPRNSVTVSSHSDTHPV